MRGGGADGFVVPSKPGNAGGGKGPDTPAEEAGQPAMGRSRCLRQGLLGEGGERGGASPAAIPTCFSPVAAGRAAGGWSVGAG